VIDLRSDTVTRPTPAMRAAMDAAELGDDVLGDDPTVKALEATIADTLGMESAIFTPSGTMANQLAIRSVCEAGDEIIAHRDSHIIHYETGGPAALSGCMINPQDGEGGIFGPSAVTDSIRSRDHHNAFSRMLVVENTHNRGGGTVWTIPAFEAVANAAHDRELHVHVDGARLFNATVAGGYEARDFLEHADTVSVCFSKALGAPVGSALAGPADLIERARRFRKMFGGTMRQSGLLAGAALYAIQHHVERLAADHQNAQVLAGELEELSGVRLDVPARETPTNMVFFQLEDVALDADTFCTALRAYDVAMIAMGPRRVRAVTHLDVDRDDVLKAAAATARVLASAGSPTS
jgi:threonine aldolase